MGFFSKKRKSDVTEIDTYEDHGSTVHVLEGDDGIVEVEKVSMADFLPTGEQWCPDCHVKCEERDGGEWFECPECNWSITADEAEEFGGYPTLNSSYHKR